MREKYSCYEYQIFENENGLFAYEIYGNGYFHYDEGVIVSNDYFDAKQEARFGVVVHSKLLKNGEG